MDNNPFICNDQFTYLTAGSTKLNFQDDFQIKNIVCVIMSFVKKTLD